MKASALLGTKDLTVVTRAFKLTLTLFLKIPHLVQLIHEQAFDTANTIIMFETMKQEQNIQTPSTEGVAAKRQPLAHVSARVDHIVDPQQRRDFQKL